MKALLPLLTCLTLLAAGCGGVASEGTNAAGAPNGTAAGPDAGVAPAQGSGSTASSDDKVVRTSSIDLKVANVRDSFTGIVSTVRGLGGYVAEGHITDSMRDSASLRLRVPASRHDDLLFSLRTLNGAKVRDERSNTTEVTAQFTDLEAQIRNLQRSEVQYQEPVGRAGSISDVVQVSAKLEEVRGRIEAAQARLKVLSDATDYATVNVALTPATAATSGLPKPGDVFATAIDATQVALLLGVNASIVVLMVAAWTLPLGLAVLFAWRTWGRHLKAMGAKLASW